VRILALPAFLLLTSSLFTPALADEQRLADGPSAPKATRDIPTFEGDPNDNLPIAIGMNLPLRWFEGASIGGSFYIGVSKRLAIRANVASWKYSDDAAATVASFLGGEIEGSMDGRITDVGAGLVHYSNKLWDGFTLEGGLLHRSKDISVRDEFATPEYVATDTTTYAVRALAGWSWLIGDHLFVAVAFGASVGREIGSETTGVMDGPSMKLTTKDVSRWDVAPEGYIRIGGGF
jgi:hypothetical protein